MDEDLNIEGLQRQCGETLVFVAKHPVAEGGFAIRLETGEMVTKFGISEATLACVFELMMRQGGIRLPGFPATFTLQKSEQ